MFRWLRLRSRGNNQPLVCPPDTPLHSMRYVVLDTEFTSLDQRSNRLLSIGALAMEGTKIRMGEQFYRVLNPGVAVPAPGIVVHQLRPDDVEKGEAPLEALEALRHFITGAVLVGHFVHMDLAVLRKELQGTEQMVVNPVVDTARVHRWLVRHGRHTEDLFHHLENVALVSLAKAYRLEFHEAHHALQDAFLTARLWQKLLCELEAHDIRTVGSLLKIAGI
jgi:DNA polymerase-3 subunit epsilon